MPKQPNEIKLLKSPAQYWKEKKMGIQSQQKLRLLVKAIALVTKQTKKQEIC